MVLLLFIARNKDQMLSVLFNSIWVKISLWHTTLDPSLECSSRYPNLARRSQGLSPYVSSILLDPDGRNAFASKTPHNAYHDASDARSFQPVRTRLG